MVQTLISIVHKRPVLIGLLRQQATVESNIPLELEFRTILMSICFSFARQDWFAGALKTEALKYRL
jgi:hypothetical protein